MLFAIFAPPNLVFDLMTLRDLADGPLTTSLPTIPRVSATSGYIITSLSSEQGRLTT